MNRASCKTILLALSGTMLMASCGKDETVPPPSTKAPAAATASRAIKPVLSFEAANEQVKTEGGERSGGVIKSTGKAGALAYGPPLELAPGRYRVRWFGEISAQSSDEPVVVDVYWDGKGQSSTQVKRPAQPATDMNAPFAQLVVDLAQPVKDFQTRVWVTQGTRLTLSRYEVIPE